MELKIYFTPDGSQIYKQIKMNCKKFDNFFPQDNGTNILKVDQNEIKRKRAILAGIVSRLKNREGSRFYINNKEVPASMIEAYLDVVACGNENSKKAPNERACSQGNGWGCLKLNRIQYSGPAPGAPQMDDSRMWYKYGSFDKGDWLVDKNTIEATIREEINEKGLELCPYFSYENINRALDTIPNRINPDHDPNWVYCYTTDPGPGGRLRKITGVAPSSNAGRDPFSTFMGGNLFGDGDNPLASLFGSLGNFNMDDLSESLGDFNLGDLFSGLGDDSFFGGGDDSFFGGGSSGPSESHSSSSSNKRGRNRDIPNTSFEDIGGLDGIIRQVREVIELPVVAPELLDYYGIKPHKGILLYGPPGCGKTLLAKAIANEINAHFIPISGPEVLNKYVGQSEENLRKVFKEAVSKAPSIIYFDEFDSIANTRNDSLDPYNARVVNQILTLLDGVDEKSRICVIASTNRIDMIDEAIKRPGRFDYVLEVAKPSLEGCEQIFDIYVRNMPLDPNFNKEQFVTNNLLGCTGAEIAFVATEAAYNSIRRTVDIDSLFKGAKLNLGSANKISESDFLKAVEALKENRQAKGRQKPRTPTRAVPPVTKM